MRFSVELNSRVKEVWRESYIQYSKLNIFLKNKVEDRWTDKDEYTFINSLETELKKVYTFIQSKLDETNRAIDQCVTLLEERENEACSSSVVDMLAGIIVDVNELSKFYALNLAGFKRIVSKHDTYTPHKIHDFFYGNMLEAYPLDEQRFDILIVRISKIYDFFRQQNESKGLVGSNNSLQKKCQTLFESTTDKYLIHPDYITELKALILLHFPIDGFSQGNQCNPSDTAISSVYYDNDTFDLYHARLSHVPGVDAIQMRWYGKINDKQDIYVERKTYLAASQSNTLVKNRFKLKECQIDEFVDSKCIADDLGQDLKKESEAYGFKKKENTLIIRSIRESILKRKLKPVCREFFNRTSFQLPKNPAIKINMDTDIAFIREDHMDGQIRRRKNKKDVNWRRLDVGIDYPFRKISDNDILRFPYAILDVKKLSSPEQEAPEWLSTLLNSHMVYKVPDFSRYIHGVSSLFEDRIRDCPPWLSELNGDIRKAPDANVGLSRSKSSRALFNGLPMHLPNPFCEPSEDDMLGSFEEKTKKNDETSPSKDQAEKVDTSPFKDESHSDKEQAKALYFVPREDDNKRQAFRKTTEQEANPQIVISMEENTDRVSSDATISIFSKYKPNFTNKENTESKEGLSESISVLGSSLKVSSRNGPRRFDAKAFFSNERTFMSWLQFCTILFTISLNLLNNGDGITRVVGSLFVIVSLFVSMYALFRFHFRAFQLRTGRASLRIDDVYGPGILCALLITALAVNFYLRIPYLFETEKA
ncbi:VTC domain-containing protein [Sporodiniella umbellata]|nr:VTC domain-containing protein [Sporodiniella umbellata]